MLHAKMFDSLLRCAKVRILDVLIMSCVIVLSIQVLVFYTFSERTAKDTPSELKSFQQISLAKLRVFRRHSKFFVVHSRSKRITPPSGPVKYVLFIPHGMTQHQESLGLNHLDGEDLKSVLFLGDVLELMPSLDGATCLSRSLEMEHRKREGGVDFQDLFTSSWCRFSKRDWSLQIRNTGETRSWRLDLMPSRLPLMAQMCNIIKGPLLIRKEKVLRKRKWRFNFGETSILDFFLRSKGHLELAKIANCFLSDSLYKMDRALNEGMPNFQEYSDLRNEHGVLRIIQEKRIEWTTCVANGKSCKEQPYKPPRSLPDIALPVCCSVVLGQMLRDLARAMSLSGLEYRVVYGTLLGAVRSKAIIPWTHDVDIAVRKSDYNNMTVFADLQKLLVGKYHIGYKDTMRRAIALYPPYIEVDASRFFDGPVDLQGGRFFSHNIVRSIRHMPWNEAFSWRSRGYIDFYPGPDEWWVGSSNVTINKEDYLTVKDPEFELKNWYGVNFRTPVRSGRDWKGLTEEGAVP